MTKAIVLLGGPNNEKGELSEIVKARCLSAFGAFEQLQDHKLLCTGGFGAHFNTTNQPHGFYVKKYLLALGVSADAFLDIAQSRFTLEDALLAKPILEAAGITQIKLITSSFHMKRAAYVFSNLCSELEIETISAPTPVNKDELVRLQAHEVTALEREKNNILALLSQT